MTITNFCLAVSRCIHATITGGLLGATLGASVGFGVNNSTTEKICQQFAEKVSGFIPPRAGTSSYQHEITIKCNCVEVFPLTATVWGAASGAVTGFLYGINREIRR
jgi:hypothetical protein